MQRHFDFIPVLFAGGRKAKGFIQMARSLVTLDGTEHHLSIAAVLPHVIKNQPGSGTPVTAPLIAFVDEKLAETVGVQVGQIVIERHAHRRIAVAEEMGLTAVIAEGIGAREQYGSGGDVMRLCRRYVHILTPILGGNFF